jgi:hypothetical protein
VSRWAFLSGILAVLLCACGVGPEAKPRSLPSEAAAAIAVPTPAPTGGAGRLLELWFVDENRLVPVNRKTTQEVITPEDKITSLEAGPTLSEMADGLRTAVTSVVRDVPLVVTAEAVGIPVEVTDTKQVAVVLSDEFASLPSQEQIFILGQVVLTLTTEPGTSVLFVNDTGTPVGVPLPGGRLSSGAVTSSDYASLIG